MKMTVLAVVGNVVKCEVRGCGQCFQNGRFGGCGQCDENDGLSGCGQCG